MPARRFIITGKVQGVFFRASTREQARRLGLRGYAKNVADGSVEVVVVGDVNAIEALTAWLQHGPPMAKVTAVHTSEVDSNAETDALALDDFVVA